ncbi:MAG: histidinol-phosphatase HisJ family protein [Candidatus Cloacimonetes bacterium]|nr:histidinol-phosphatase HisJ family protein [Candidatus Cloacimonadota bacterium]
MNLNNFTEKVSNNKIDTHLHGKYSSDSILGYRELCQKAIEKGYGVIAFTEHYDLIDTELKEYGLLPIKRYVVELAEIKKEYPDLEIITGIELGEPHIVGDFANRLFLDCKIEYIIGSLHVTRSGVNVSLRLPKPMSKKEITEYYEENLEMVKKGGFDTLGHLGIYKRGLGKVSSKSDSSVYIPDENHVYIIIDEIFRQMIKKEICLEVNASGFKVDFNNHIPEPEILLRYKKLGGKLITICSDSHDLGHFDRFYQKTLDNLRGIGFLELYWKKGRDWNSNRIHSY